MYTKNYIVFGLWRQVDFEYEKIIITVAAIEPHRAVTRAITTHGTLLLEIQRK